MRGFCFGFFDLFDLGFFGIFVGVNQFVCPQSNLGAVTDPLLELFFINLESFGLRSIKSQIINKITIVLGPRFGNNDAKCSLVFFPFGEQFYLKHRMDYSII